MGAPPDARQLLRDRRITTGKTTKTIVEPPDEPTNDSVDMSHGSCPTCGASYNARPVNDVALEVTSVKPVQSAMTASARARAPSLRSPGMPAAARAGYLGSK